MLTVLRHMLSILLLPFVVVAVIPYWLLTAFASFDNRWHGVAAIVLIPHFVGVAAFIIGFAVFVWCVALFARVGRGTLAPWDPTLRLVAVGPYRFVRNPMISGVATMLAGEALFYGSWILVIWTCIFVLINHFYFVLSEEPALEKRFGEDYRKYKANVPRWLPRRKRQQGG